MGNLQRHFRYKNCCKKIRGLWTSLVSEPACFSAKRRTEAQIGNRTVVVTDQKMLLEPVQLFVLKQQIEVQSVTNGPGVTGCRWRIWAGHWEDWGYGRRKMIG